MSAKRPYQPTAGTRRIEYGGTTGTENRYTHLLLGCPGCGGFHTVYVNTEPGDTGLNPWEWDGNLDAPTVSPSILVNATRPGHRCHSFVRGGMWEFLSDCDHALAGQTVPLAPLPEWALTDLTATNGKGSS